MEDKEVFTRNLNDYSIGDIKWKHAKPVWNGRELLFLGKNVNFAFYSSRKKRKKERILLTTAGKYKPSRCQVNLILHLSAEAFLPTAISKISNREENHAQLQRTQRTGKSKFSICWVRHNMNFVTFDGVKKWHLRVKTIDICRTISEEYFEHYLRSSVLKFGLTPINR